MPLFQITRVASSHTKVLGYVPADNGVSALREWGARGIVPDDWLEAEVSYGFGDGEEVTETAPASDHTSPPTTIRKNLAIRSVP